MIARAALFHSLILLWPLAGCSRPEVQAAGSIHLRFWNGFTGPDGKTMEKMVAQFQQENPAIRVDMQIIPWAQYYDKLTLGLAFDKGPHVFICHANRLPEFAQYHAFKPLDAFIEGSEGLPKDDFIRQAWEAAHFGDRLY